MKQGSARRGALRRYPALGFLAVAGVLALLLPSALTLPNSGPPTLAELAPVPGDGPGSGDLGRLGSGASGEIGSGEGAGGAGAPPPPADPGRPGGRLKRCVGEPPRQTEDPLSPPCVAFFQGENGGRTSPGVTADSITIVLHHGFNNTRGVTFIDYDDPIDGSEGAQELSGKVFVRYFNERYQFYGRRLRAFGYYGHFTESRGQTPSDIRADVRKILTEKRPFAILPVGTGAQSGLLATEAAREGIVVTTYQGFERAVYRRVAPRLFSYSPDVEGNAALAADYACRRLAGRPARLSGVPTDRTVERRFGVIYTTSEEEPSARPLARRVRTEMARRCDTRVVESSIEGTGRDTWDDYPLALANLRQQGVTTVMPVTKAGDPLVMLNAASSIGWHPEWFFPRLGLTPDDTTSAQTYPREQWTHAFGISPDVRRGRVEQQHWFLAFKEACPSCTVPRGYFPTYVYTTMSLLSYGVQSAGPRLTAESLDKGLHAISPRASTSPAVPATYMRPGEYSLVKDAKEMWWDPTGTPPGGQGGGCYRLPRDGRRAREGEWPRGDETLGGPGQPCQGYAQL